MPITTTTYTSTTSSPSHVHPHHSDNSHQPQQAPAAGEAVQHTTTVTPAVQPTVLSRFILHSNTILRLVDLKLAVKMALLVVILNPGDMRRLASLTTVAVLAFLYQTGIFAALATILLMREAGQQGNEEQVGDGVNHSEERTLWQNLVAISKELGDGNISQEGGILVDLYVVVASLFLSLFPT